MWCNAVRSMPQSKQYWRFLDLRFACFVIRRLFPKRIQLHFCAFHIRIRSNFLTKKPVVSLIHFLIEFTSSFAWFHFLWFFSKSAFNDLICSFDVIQESLDAQDDAILRNSRSKFARYISNCSSKFEFGSQESELRCWGWGPFPYFSSQKIEFW